jgi:hypothetical protein
MPEVNRLRRTGPSEGPPTASAEVAAIRRTVWRRRLAVILVVAGVVSSYYLVLDRRVAHLRDPAVALSADSQVYPDALRFLTQPAGQLALQATTLSTARLGPVGSLPPQSPRVDTAGRVWLNISGYGSVGEYGAPIVFPGGESEITSHKQDVFGLVRQVTLECRYTVCWDRNAHSGRVLAAGDPLPDLESTELVRGLKRYSVPEVVTDALTMGLSGSSRRWEVVQVRRLERQDYVTSP